MVLPSQNNQDNSNGNAPDGGKRPHHVNFGEILKHMFNIREDAATNAEIRDRILSGGRITGTNMVVMVCAVFIASAGLITDSVAVIIGAMLVSPLMGTILATAYGTASNNGMVIERFGFGFIIQVLMSVAAATIFFLLCPVKQATAQIIARTQPGWFDVIIATAGGVAGIVGQTRQDKSNTIIPGVAIATALMPPLCTCGWAIANMHWRMLLGAFYLFVINTYFIYVSAVVVLGVLNTPHIRAMTKLEWHHKRHKMIRNTILVLLPIILVAFSLV